MEYRSSNQARQGVTFLDLPKSPETGSRVDLYKWDLPFIFEESTPNWSRMMQQGQAHPRSSSIISLPMINMNSGDMTCIYARLNYVHGLAPRYYVPTVTIFDQPLFWKALEIVHGLPVSHPPKDTIVRLGNFHTIMNL